MFEGAITSRNGHSRAYRPYGRGEAVTCTDAAQKRALNIIS